MAKKRIDRHEEDERRRKKALADLAGLEHGGEGLPGHAMGNAADAAKKRMEAMGYQVDDQNTDDDPIEQWGTFIGRGLGFLFVAYLIWYLISTYVLK